MTATTAYQYNDYDPLTKETVGGGEFAEGMEETFLRDNRLACTMPLACEHHKKCIVRCETRGEKRNQIEKRRHGLAVGGKLSASMREAL